MRYLSEIAAAWRPLLAAMLGLATGNSIVGVITSAIAPSLIADAGWTKAQFAMIGSLSLATAVVLPVIGRLADLFGVRRTAGVGLAFVPLVYLAYAQFGRSLTAYVLIFVFQITVCVTTSSLVYTRLVVRHVQHARGLALAICASSPALAGLVVGPVLSGFVDSHGWQAGYRALALFVACTGVVTFLLIPPDGRARKGPVVITRHGKGDLHEVLRTPALWILAGAMALCNLPGTLPLTQLKVLVLDHGLDSRQAAVMFTALSSGMLAGRIVTGLALDRLPPHLVAGAALAVPTLGLFLLATPIVDARTVGAAVFLIGFAHGAEGDAMAYLVSRYFRIAVFSSVMGLLTAVISASTAAGALLLSVLLARTGAFTLFLNLCGGTVLVGAALLVLLGRCPRAEPDAVEALA